MEAGKLNEPLENPPRKVKVHWFKQAIGSLETGSLSNAVLSLMTTGISGVCLSLPLILQEAGLILGLFVIQLTGFVSLIAMQSVSKASQRTRLPEFLEVTEEILGSFIAKLLALLIVMFTIDHLLLYEVMGNLHPAARLFFSIFPELYEQRTTFILLCNIICLILYALMRDYENLRFLACLSFLGLAYVGVVLLVELPTNPEFLNNVGEIKLAKWGNGIFTAMSICKAAYLCPTNIAPISEKLRNPIRRRFKRINYTIIAIEQGLYTFLALVGYLSSIRSTPEIVTDRPYRYDDQSDTLMTIGRVILCAALIIDIPTFLPHCSASVETLLHWESTHVLHIPATVVVMLVPVLLTIYNLDVGFILALLAAQSAWFFFFVPGER